MAWLFVVILGIAASETYAADRTFSMALVGCATLLAAVLVLKGRDDV